MSTSPSFRGAALTLLVTVLWPGTSTATVLTPELSVRAGTDAQVNAVNPLLAEANFQYPFATEFEAARQSIHDQLRAAGFTRLWSTAINFGTFTAWYSAERNLSVVCGEGWSPAGLTHRAYAVPGRLSRKERLLE